MFFRSSKWTGTAITQCTLPCFRCWDGAHLLPEYIQLFSLCIDVQWSIKQEPGESECLTFSVLFFCSSYTFYTKEEKMTIMSSVAKKNHALLHCWILIMNLDTFSDESLPLTTGNGRKEKCCVSVMTSKWSERLSAVPSAVPSLARGSLSYSKVANCVIFHVRASLET